MSHSRNPPPRGQGAARAKQMGLLLDLTPDRGMDDGGNDEDLEAEPLSLVGGGGKGGRPQGKKGDGRSPVPMAEIERLAALCMTDLEDEEMDDEDLLFTYRDGWEDTPAPTPPAATLTAPKVNATSPKAPSGASGLESCLQERIDMYQKAINNAKAAGETSEARRYDRGLKTLQSMLTSVKKGKPINEEEIPPPVAIGATSNPPAESEPVKERQGPALIPSPPSNQQRLGDPAPEPPNSKPEHLSLPQKTLSAVTPETPAISPLTPGQPDAQHSELKQAVLSRQREYKMAAIEAKQNGDVNLAKQHYLTAKKLDSLLEAVDQGQPVDLSSLPPPPVQQQVDFLLQRQAFLRAALHSKQMKDMTGAAQHLRHAKGLDPMITAAKSGLPVDITKIPSVPVSGEDYSLGRSRTSPGSSRSSEKYHALMDLLRKQHEKCMGLSQQFTLMGNIAEALKLEKLVEESMKYIDLLKNAHAKGQPVPKCHTQERTFNTPKINSNLSPNDLVLYIIRCINLPPPSGGSANELDASVKFEFPFPSSEDAQRDKTGTVKNTSSPEFKEQFRLNINRTHRGFKRVVQSKGIKFEVVHKGGLFKTDKAVGTAHLKLEGLENHCEIREIIEVMDGRKATGGKLEVSVKIRDPISGVDVQPITEKWYVLEQVLTLSPPEKQKERAPSPRSKPKHESSGRSAHPNSSPPQYKLHSFSLLNYDRERLERKIGDYRKNHRDPPPDLVQQHKEVTHRLHWQKAQLERASPALLTEYENVLLRFVQGLSESVKKYSSQGNREAAKDALGRLKMVEGELESLKRKRTG